jgi:hypothetical protein
MHNKENAVRNERRESGGVFSSLLEHPQPETECSMEALVVSLRQDNHRLRTKCNQHIKRLQSYLGKADNKSLTSRPSSGPWDGHTSLACGGCRIYGKGTFE